MKSAIIGALAVLALSAPARALTVEQGVVYITQADALTGSVTPGDTAGFPITLSVSGSYRLASNLLVNTAVNAIEVNAPEITIDLAGFRMAGSGVGLGAIVSYQRGLTVKNGTIRGFVDDVIYSHEYLVVDHMRIVDNPIANPNLAAVKGDGDYATVRNSNISRNSGYAVVCYKYCVLANNIILGSGNTFAAVNFIKENGFLLGNTISNSLRAIFAVQPVSFGNNTMVGNTYPSFGTLLPLDPNQPPPPP